MQLPLNTAKHETQYVNPTLFNALIRQLQLLNVVKEEWTGKQQCINVYGKDNIVYVVRLQIDRSIDQSRDESHKANYLTSAMQQWLILQRRLAWSCVAVVAIIVQNLDLQTWRNFPVTNEPVTSFTTH